MKRKARKRIQNGMKKEDIFFNFWSTLRNLAMEGFKLLCYIIHPCRAHPQKFPAQDIILIYFSITNSYFNRFSFSVLLRWANAIKVWANGIKTPHQHKYYKKVFLHPTKCLREGIEILILSFNYFKLSIS